MVLEDCVSYFEGDVGSRSHYIRGQGYRPHKTYIYRHKHYDSGSPVIGYEHPNACARFIDCEWIDLDNGNTSLPYNATNCILDLLDGDSNSSLLYGFSSDTSKPVYTGQTNVEVISGDKLNLALTADRPVSWEFASEGWTWSTDDQLYPLGYMCKDGFRLERFFSGGMAILRKWKGTLGGETATNDVAMVYDPEGDNEYTTAVVCESAAGVKSDPINITVTVSPLAANFPTFHEVTKTQNATAQTSHLVHMPPTVNAGDTLIMAVMIDGGPTVTWDHAAAGWTKLSSDGTSTEQRFFLYIKLSAVGNEDGATIDVTTNNAEPFAAQVARWSNVQDYVRVTGANSAGPNPGALTSPWGTDKNAWQLFVGANGSTTFAEPAGYSVMDRNTSGTSTSHVCVASTRKNDQKPTEDCPTLAISGNGPTSWAMICLRPQA